MTDLFGAWVNEKWLDRIFAVMALANQHTFQVLTKRVERIHAYVCDPNTVDRIHMQTWKIFTDRIVLKGAWPLPNVQLGVTAEDQPRADERIPWLLQTPAAVRFLSCEPLLRPIDLKPRPPDQRGCCLIDHRHDGSQGPCQTHGIDWIIAGGESGRHARPMHPDWARSLRDQCQAAGVPFFFKQWGEWLPRRQMTLRQQSEVPDKIASNGKPVTGDQLWRVGKKAAGRLLDGREWNEFPVYEAAHA